MASAPLAPTVLSLQQPTQANGVTLKLQELTDSRCPLNVMCVRYGSAVAALQLQDGSGNRATQRLYLGEALPAPDNRGFRGTDSVEVALGNQRFLLVLHEVQPYPVTPNEAHPAKTAKVTVRPL
ncbi:hypothetical protein [Rufibacter quisquiliarum]|uniref:Uncharacterized protein n=1 Tax=Rufibacter quisquiliarum TaxID=1549639 RepID=A0A839GS84_9BACT|nr:hypothetical protein [Rufibacter quisquiliarum]MBA9077686.1 hypothetical protein [Rufibacter quisquiliarum]